MLITLSDIPVHRVGPDWRRRVGWLLSGLILLSGAAIAAPDSDPKADLEKLRAQIETLQKRVAAQRGEKDQVAEQLGKLERRAGRLAADLNATEARIESHRQRRNQVEADLRAQESRVRTQRRALASQLRAFYKMGERHSLKLLLSQEDASVLGRMLQYSGFIGRARSEAVAAAAAAIAELDRLRAELGRVETELLAERQRMLNERNELEATRGARSKVLHELERALRKGDRRLVDMRDQEDSLQKLIISIGELLDDIPDAPYERQPFASLAGRLPWPTEGKIRASYNSWRSRGNLRWKGLLIGAPGGRAVKSVYYGQVVFADWLPGFGLMLIVDHGEGFMTLYGHNQSLVKATGDWVEPGETIATVGDTGGQSQNALYFEVRKAGKPVNPTRWIGRRYRAALR